MVLDKTLTEAAQISVAFLPADAFKVVLAAMINKTSRPKSMLART